MKSILFTGFLFLQVFCACTGSDKNVANSEDDIGTARGFIHSALIGDYKNARLFIIQDSLNTQFLDAFERNYKERMTRDDKNGYREASINIGKVAAINDSVTIVYYSNSFKKEQDSLKLLRQNGTWLVDLKYSFSGKELLP